MQHMQNIKMRSTDDVVWSYTPVHTLCCGCLVGQVHSPCNHLDCKITLTRLLRLLFEWVLGSWHLDCSDCSCIELLSSHLAQKISCSWITMHVSIYGLQRLLMHAPRHFQDLQAIQTWPQTCCHKRLEDT